MPQDPFGSEDDAPLDQIAIVNAAFTPSDEGMRAAEELLAAASRAGTGAFEYRGQMVDVPHLIRARKLLERAGLSPVRALE